MSMMIVPVGSVSPYSATPVADATALINQATNPGSPPTIAWTYWNDPQTALGLGTGAWQFKGVAYFTPPGASDQAMFVVACSGNAATSVGGAPAAPAPSFAGMIQVKGPLFGGGGGVGSSGRNVSGNSVVISEWVAPTNPAALVNDLNTARLTYGSTNPLKSRYYYDPQTAVGAGTGIWRMQHVLWMQGYTSMIAIQTGGCALASVGGGPAMPPPPAFTGFTQMLSLFPFL